MVLVFINTEKICTSMDYCLGGLAWDRIENAQLGAQLPHRSLKPTWSVRILCQLADFAIPLCIDQ